MGGFAGGGESEMFSMKDRERDQHQQTAKGIPEQTKMLQGAGGRRQVGDWRPGFASQHCHPSRAAACSCAGCAVPNSRGRSSH